jgi:GTP-binding protein
MQMHSNWKGNRGAHGLGKDCHGKGGEDIYVSVPAGTVVRDRDSGELLADLSETDGLYLAAEGGRGGKGNARFLSNSNRAPRFAELGEPGTEGEFLLELKLIAEVGLVGLPNAGKSTLLSVISAAKPKIADYPFTTISPNLGVAMLSDHRTLTVADIPGIIEGAAEGKGMGHDFLRHIERTKLLLFLIDLGDEDPAHTCAILEEELDQHSEVFADRPRMYVLNKADVPENRERFEAVAAKLDKPLLLSGATKEGIDELLEAAWARVDQIRQEEAGVECTEPEREYAYEAPYTIKKTKASFRIEGKTVMRAVRMTDFQNEQAVRHLQHKLDKMGLFKALKRMGAHEGQSIFIGDVELEYHAD